MNLMLRKDSKSIITADFGKKSGVEENFVRISYLPTNCSMPKDIIYLDFNEIEALYKKCRKEKNSEARRA